MITPRAEVRALPLAEHGGRHALIGNVPATELIDFSVCLNAHGPATSVVDAIRAASIDEYPDPRSTVARAAIAAAWNTPMASLMIGAGSAELIQSACFAYLRRGDTALVVDPAFGEYRRAASLCGADVVGIAIARDETPLQPVHVAIHRFRPRLVFLATPVNPLGIAFSREQLAALANACIETDTLLLLDQAYDAFATTPLGTPALADHPNVLHLRSLTKEHALAGVRVAVGVGPAQIVADVDAVRVPWATSTAAQTAAIATLSDDARRHAAGSIARLGAERCRIAEALSTDGIETFPSNTHYMLIACSSAATLRDRLIAEQRILVRDCTSFGLPRHVRIAARLPHENDALIYALRTQLS